jgi:hypothetical protein
VAQRYTKLDCWDKTDSSWQLQALS